MGVATATGAVGAIVGCSVGSDIGSSVVAWSVGAANSGDGVEQASSVERMINEETIRKLRIYGAITPTILNGGDYTETVRLERAVHTSLTPDKLAMAATPCDVRPRFTGVPDEVKRLVVRLEEGASEFI